MSEYSKTKKLQSTYPHRYKELEEYLDSFPISADFENNRSFLINSIHRAQQIFGYVPFEVQELIADKLRLNICEVYGIISFYSYFTTQPRGKYIIRVCMGTACYVRGAEEILQELKKETGIEEGETSNDQVFTLEVGRCFGACGLAPIITINEKVYKRMDKSQVKSVIEKYKAQ